MAEGASTSRPPPAASVSSVLRRKYDVFLSFRGTDTRRTIASSIFHELQSRSIKTFMDDSPDTGLEAGKPISPGLVEAIKESRSAIVVLSPNYASSSWCLDELTLIVQCMEDKKMIVLPIFYGLKPSHVRSQKKSFAKALSRHEKRFSVDVVKGWRAALTKVANLSGLESDKYRSDQELAKIIVKTVWGNLVPIASKWATCTGEFIEFEGRREVMSKIMMALLDDEVTTIGIFGMGGVGKTTMVKHVAAQARETGLFDHVIMAVVSQTPNLRNIQGTLADLLGLKLQEETDKGRADRLIQSITTGYKILIILDDIWNPMDLSSIGIPNKRDLQKCNSKILLTTRRRNVCHSMSSQENIPLPVLSEDDAWELFLLKAGKSFDESADLYNIARTVAKECGGLPVALVAVARALGDKDFDDWTQAAQRLKAAQPAHYEDGREAYSCIKLSYDFLSPDDNNIAKSLFLLCCLFPEDFDIPVEDLLVYAIGKGMFHDALTIKEARDKTHSVVKYLKGSSLLLDSPYNGFVKMHDVVRDVAISISSSEDGPRFLVKAGCELRDWPAINIAYEGYSAVSLMRNEIQELPRTLVCSELQILLLQSNDISEIPNRFFQSPNELRVLDLRETSISLLPSSLSLLIHLQALYLDECKRMDDISILGKLMNLQILSMKNFRILSTGGTRQKALPKEIGCLTNLKMLDVTDACFQTVPSKVISKLKGLEELYMKCDFYDWGSRIAEGSFLSFVFGNNASFDELTGLSRLNSLRVHISDVECLPQEVKFNPNWDNFDICISQKEFFKQSYYQRFFEKLAVKFDAHRHTFRHLTLNTSMEFLPYWFTKAVTGKALTIEYMGYRGLLNILEEYHRGRLHVMKCLAVIDCHVSGVLMRAGINVPSDIPVFEILENLYLEGVSGLRSICVGELPPRSLSNLKLLNVKNCPELEDVLLQSNLLSRLHNLERLHCENAVRGPGMANLEGPGISSVFDTDGFIFIPKLKEITLCYLENLGCICRFGTDLPPFAAFSALKSLAIRGCPKLTYLFDYNVNGSLMQLELLWVEECFALETVIHGGQGSEIIFPKLKDIYLNSLPQLEGIGSDGVKCPSLEHLYVYGCPKHSNLAVSAYQSKNQVQVNDEGHFAMIFGRLFHHQHQFNAEEFPQFFSKQKSSKFDAAEIPQSSGKRIDSSVSMERMCLDCHVTDCR